MNEFTHEITMTLLGIALMCSYIANYKQLKKFIEYESNYSKQESQSADDAAGSRPVYRNIFLSGVGCCAGSAIAIVGILSIVFILFK